MKVCFTRGVAAAAVLVATMLAPTAWAGVRDAKSGGTVVAPAIKLQFLGRYESGLFDEGGAEVIAFDAATSRVFVVNAAETSIDVLDLRRPAQPQLLFKIDGTPYGGGINSVAVKNGVVAAAVESDPKQLPGKIVFFDVNGAFLAAVEVGALPDMVTFTPDGRFVLAANEGEPADYCSTGLDVDPRGSISIIDISGGAANVTQANVRSAGFEIYDAAGAPAGVRVFGPGASVSQDLEPEYIAVSDDSRTAWVTLQEANALAVVSIEDATVDAVLPLGVHRHDAEIATLRNFGFDEMPSLGTTAAGQQIALGGFSGLFFEGLDRRNGRLIFVTHPDRGPNAQPFDFDGDGNVERPFPLPDFQLRIVRFALDLRSGEAQILEQIPLTRADGTPITGLPNVPGPVGPAFRDEVPTDLFGNVLDRDAFGGDIEGIVRVEDGTYWIVDEFRPAIYHFTAWGSLIERFVPAGSNAFGEIVGTEALPAVYGQRRANRGFEAVAYQNGKIYAFIQSPLDNPDTPNDASSKKSRNGRILEFDPVTKTTTAEYLYIFEGGGSDKIGDAVSQGGGKFLLIERDDAISLTAKKALFEIDLAGATNLATLPAEIAGPGGTLELLDKAGLDAAGIKPVAKRLAANLARAGYSFADKPEGLAKIADGVFAIINDNDFKLAGTFDPVTGLLDPNPNAQEPIVTLVNLRTAGLDASDRDDAINIARWPAQGFYMPDAIASYTIDGQTYLFTANEGDARDYDCFSEEERVRGVDLDPVAFPNASTLRDNANMGRLNITTANGDLDGDGDFDVLHSYGTRSFTIWTPEGRVVFDSGDDFERVTARAFPDDFNSGNDENGDFDGRSDNKGPEPEAIAIGEVGGRVYAFIGLERIGGIMVYDVTDPAAAGFVQYINSRDFAGDPEEGTAGDLGIETLVFVPREQSPTGQALLISGNEISGTTAIFAVRPGARPIFRR